VENTVQGTVGDYRWDDTADDFAMETLSDNDDAQMSLQGGSLSVSATKTFTPAVQTEPGNPEITMTLAARPDGSERTTVLLITDDRATFWNGYDFKRVSNAFTLPGFAPNANPLQVEFSVCTGRSFDADEIDA